MEIVEGFEVVRIGQVAGGATGCRIIKPGADTTLETSTGSNMRAK